MNVRAQFNSMIRHRALRSVVVAAWLMLCVLGFVLIDHYNTEEKQHSLRLWEQRLALAANSQAEAVATIISQRTSVLTSMAENVSLRLYLTTIDNTNPADAEAEYAFLRNYLLASAEQAQLSTKSSEAASLPASVAAEAERGLALIGNNGKTIISTRHFPLTVPEGLLAAPRDKPYTLTAPLADGRSWLAVPIYAVQEDPLASEPIGWLVGTFLAFDALDALLAKGELSNSPATSLLVYHDGNTARVIAPKNKREHPLQSTQYTTLAARAQKEPKTLLSGKDINHRPAFAYSAEVGDTGWVLVREVTRKAALQETEKRGSRLLMLFGLTIATITLTIVALWRHATAERLQYLLKRIQHHERLLELITEHIPAQLFIVDAQARYRYANREAARAANATRDDMIGKSLSQALGTAAAKPYVETNARVLQRGMPETLLHEKTNEHGYASAARIQHIPLEDLPESYAQGGQAVLIIHEDLTEVMQAKYAHQQSLKTLIDTILTIADRRDPNASYHSIGVSIVARAIAETMQLEKMLIDTAGIAGQLMNLGKLFIPQDVLTSQKPIDPSDKQLIAESLSMAIEHLSDVPFEGPVIETLRQAQEKPDGSGPLQLSDHHTLVTARIVIVANSFVALTSKRSYRKQLPIPEAVAVIQKSSGSNYSPSVVAALSHYIGNLGGDARWNEFLSRRS